MTFGIQKDVVLPGEKKIRYTSAAPLDAPVIDYESSSDVNKIIWAVARIIGMVKQKSLEEGNTSFISPQLFRDAENLLVKDVQKGLKEEIVKKTKRRSLCILES